MNVKSPIRIMLIDDNPFFLDALRDFIGIHEAFEVAGSTNDGSKAVAMAHQIEPDIILLDLNLGELSGLDLIPVFKKTIPHTKIIILTIMEGKNYHTIAQKIGSDAFVNKIDITTTLLPTMDQLMGASVIDKGVREEPDVT